MLGWLWPSSNNKPTSAKNPSACPVDHATVKTDNACPVQPAAATENACPVDHTTRQAYATLAQDPSKTLPRQLDHQRVVSSIPRWSEDDKESSSKWVYPSTAQFYESLQRKSRNPDAQDMSVVVPIHNAVNEQAWQEVLKWELTKAPKEDIKLVSFKGRPNDTSPKAWIKSLAGYKPPFDRHDWLIDRAGTRVRYVIDFYNGRTPLSFYLDTRPALDNFECLQMRVSRFLGLAPEPNLSKPAPSST